MFDIDRDGLDNCEWQEYLFSIQLLSTTTYFRMRSANVILMVRLMILKELHFRQYLTL